MLAFLSKKISFQNNTKITCLAWNKESDVIAIGGENGFIKIINVEVGANADATKVNNFTIKYTLKEHDETICLLMWNETYEKLISCDVGGEINVWVFKNNEWFVEMTNNRQKSTVADIKWSPNNKKVCILYEDGAVLVGTVDGEKIWSKDIKKHPTCMCWSPNSNMLLFGFQNGQVLLYDDLGNLAVTLEIKCLKNETSFVRSIIWNDRAFGNSLILPLVISYENGRVQMMRNELDDNPTLIFTGMLILHACWNVSGTILAVCGRQQDGSKEINLVHFYDNLGDHLGLLKVPGNSVLSIAWEGNSLGMGLVVDNSVYFAAIRHEYKWCYFKNTFVFANNKFNSGRKVTFWNEKSNFLKTVNICNVLDMASFNEHCVLAVCSDYEKSEKKHCLLLYNTMGICVDRQYLDIEINFVAMNGVYVAGFSKNVFIVWQYKTPKSLIYSTSYYISKIYHVDGTPTGLFKNQPLMQDLDDNLEHSIYSICCVAMSNELIVIGRESGMLQFYMLPDVVLINKQKLPMKPLKISLNCNSTRLSVIDISGNFNIISISELTTASNVKDDVISVERKDVWSMCWCHDNPNLVAFIEKNQLNVYNCVSFEEPMACLGHIYSFKDLTVKTILLPLIIQLREKPSKNHLVFHETRLVCELRKLIQNTDLEEAFKYAEKINHPYLWRIMSQEALKEQHLDIAEVAFIQIKDYVGIKLIKKLRLITNEFSRKAEIAIYFKKYDEAEKFYLEGNRPDLATEMYQTIGEWHKIVHNCSLKTTIPETVTKNSYNNIAFNLACSGKWSEAVNYYEYANNPVQVMNCLLQMENYKSLEQMIDSFSDGDLQLKYLGDIFASEALCSPAVRAYVKAGHLETALNLCLLHSRWDQAFELAKTHKLEVVQDLFDKYNTLLIQKRCFKLAIAINVQTKKFKCASDLVHSIAFQVSRQNVNLLNFKKMFVLGGLLFEMHNDKNKKYLEDRSERDAWKGAEAYHFLILAHNQLYEKRFHSAVITLYRLQEYLNYISEKTVYSLLALAAYLDEAYGICSRALIKLKTLPDVTPPEMNAYKKLAVDMFSSHDPVDLQEYKSTCFNCKESIDDWNIICPLCNTHFPTCIATGRPVIDEIVLWQCAICHHFAQDSQIRYPIMCPLCHSCKEQSPKLFTVTQKLY